MFYFFLLGTHVTMTDAHTFLFFFWWPSNIFIFFNRSHFFFLFFLPLCFSTFVSSTLFSFRCFFSLGQTFVPTPLPNDRYFSYWRSTKDLMNAAARSVQLEVRLLFTVVPLRTNYGWSLLPYSLIEWIPRIFLVLFVCSQTLFLGVAASTGRQ